jgi:cytidyltransferase-like protein
MSSIRLLPWILLSLIHVDDAFQPFHAVVVPARGGVRSLLTTTVRCQAYKHALAILVMPETSMDRIANEAVIEAVLPETRKLSVVLRCQKGVVPSTASLRRYVGEVYSQLWDAALGADLKTAIQNPNLPNVVVYPQNLPNAAPESWIDIQADLDCICSHDFTVGWTSETASSSTNSARGKIFETVSGNGVGGLEEHVANVNRERAQRKLQPVQALHVDGFESFALTAAENHVTFLDDDEPSTTTVVAESANGSFLSGAAPTLHQHVFDSVCVGGTFDGLHFGHRKLLTLAVSSVMPVTGKLLVGVTVNEMLKKKTFAEHIPSCSERCEGVRQFLYRLAPGMMNRIQVVAIADEFGPPGHADKKHNKFDALVLSHETLQTGYSLNQHRVEHLGLPPLKLLCTRRTEAHGMSSTALRRLRNQQRQATGNVVL